MYYFVLAHVRAPSLVILRAFRKARKLFCKALPRSLLCTNKSLSNMLITTINSLKHYQQNTENNMYRGWYRESFIDEPFCYIDLYNLLADSPIFISKYIIDIPADVFLWTRTKSPKFKTRFNHINNDRTFFFLFFFGHST